MNMFMHEIDEFLIVQGNTLDEPRILENDQLKQFDVIMANPPYSVKKWSQKKFINDPYGRNQWGTPPQGCADYAFQQHIIKIYKKKILEEMSLCASPANIVYKDEYITEFDDIEKHLFIYC